MKGTTTDSTRTPNPNADNYYLLIGASSDADQDTIEAAIREAKKHYHPDTTPLKPVVARECFKRLDDVQKTLAEPDERERYNTFVEEFGYTRGHELYTVWESAGRPTGKEDWEHIKQRSQAGTARSDRTQTDSERTTNQSTHSRTSNTEDTTKTTAGGETTTGNSKRRQRNSKSTGSERTRTSADDHHLTPIAWICVFVLNVGFTYAHSYFGVNTVLMDQLFYDVSIFNSVLFGVVAAMATVHIIFALLTEDQWATPQVTSHGARWTVGTVGATLGPLLTIQLLTTVEYIAVSQFLIRASGAILFALCVVVMWTGIAHWIGGTIASAIIAPLLFITVFLGGQEGGIVYAMQQVMKGDPYMIVGRIGLPRAIDFWANVFAGTLLFLAPIVGLVVVAVSLYFLASGTYVLAKSTRFRPSIWLGIIYAPLLGLLSETLTVTASTGEPASALKSTFLTGPLGFVPVSVLLSLFAPPVVYLVLKTVFEVVSRISGLLSQL